METMKVNLKKEDWEDMRDNARRYLKDSVMNAAVHSATIELAEKHIKKFSDDGKNKKLAGNAAQVQTNVQVPALGA